MAVTAVVAGLDPATPLRRALSQCVPERDGRDKPGHDVKCTGTHRLADLFSLGSLTYFGSEYSTPHPVPMRGAFAIVHERGAGCGGRNDIGAFWRSIFGFRRSGRRPVKRADGSSACPGDSSHERESVSRSDATWDMEQADKSIACGAQA